MPKDENYEQKAVDTSQISAWDPQVLSDMVDTVARRNHVMGNVVAEEHDRTDDAGSSFEVRERGSLDVQQQSENTEISTEDLSYSTTDITVDKYGESVEITREAEEDGLDVQQEDVAEELGEAFADSMDQTAYDTVTGATSAETVQLDTAGSLTKDEIVDIRAKIRANKYNADSIVIHPDMEAEMLKIDDFTHVNKYGDEDVLQTAEFGRILNTTVYVSVTANAKGTTGGSGTTQLVMMDSERALHRVMKRDITIRIDEEERFDRDTVVGTARWGHGVVNAGAIGRLEN